jgi:hypothetical protein
MGAKIEFFSEFNFVLADMQLQHTFKNNATYKHRYMAYAVFPPSLTAVR